jgi:cytoskeletal protein CcmA (bactofilin family)
MPDIRYIPLEEAAQLIQQAPDSDTKINIQQHMDAFAEFVEDGTSRIALYEGDTVLPYLAVKDDMIIVNGNLTVTGTLEDCLEVNLSLLLVFGNVTTQHLFTFSQICITGDLTVKDILVADSICISSLDVQGDLRARMIFEKGHWFDIKGTVTADNIYAWHSKTPRGVLQPGLEDEDLPDELKTKDELDLSRVMQALINNNSDFLK